MKGKTDIITRPVLFPILLFLVVAPVSCVTFAGKLPTEEALDELNNLRTPDYPSFSGVGSLEVSTGGAKKQAATILLALDGSRYRLELLDAVGRAVLAVAGDGERMIKVDPVSGAREEIKGPEAGRVSLGSVRAPVAALRSIVTGAPPVFKSVRSASLLDGRRRALVEGPEMELVYSDRLERVAIPAGEGGVVVYELGPMARGPMAPYVSSVKITLEGAGEATVRWRRVSQGRRFPEGFFAFNDSTE